MKEKVLLTYLIDLLKLGVTTKPIRVSTAQLATLYGSSQQSASRIVNELATGGYIHKELRNGRLWIALTERGMSEVNEYIKYILDAYENPGKVILEGFVESGLGEGAYYMSKRQYQVQFKNILGFYPYPGTLNVRLKDPYYISQNRLLRRLPGYEIKGFRSRERHFGGAKTFKAIIQDRVEGAVVYAERSIHGYDVVEVISQHYLRGLLNLKDGDKVKVEVLLIG